MYDNDTTSYEGPISLRERQRHAQEEAILTAARALISEKGFEATTMDDIAARAGISKPTLYARFPNKEAIVVRAIVEIQKETIGFIRSLSPEIPPAERLRTILQRTFTRKFVNRYGPFGAQRAALVPQIRANPDYRKRAEEILAALVSLVEEGQRDGSFLPHVNARLVAQTMFSCMRDTEIDELIVAGVVTGETVVETLTDIILRGIETR